MKLTHKMEDALRELYHNGPLPLPDHHWTIKRGLLKRGLIEAAPPLGRFYSLTLLGGDVAKTIASDGKDS